MAQPQQPATRTRRSSLHSPTNPSHPHGTKRAGAGPDPSDPSDSTQPPSWKRLNSYGRLGCPIHDEHAPFITPSYLRGSRYVARLRRGWESHVRALREGVAAGLELGRGAPGGMDADASVEGESFDIGEEEGGFAGAVGKALLPQHVHCGVATDVIERAPHGGAAGAREQEGDASRPPLTPLPSRWSEDDRTAGTEVLAEGSEVRYSGVSKVAQSDEAASIRADAPMPREAGMFYFEVTILSRSREGMVGVGFSGRKVSLHRLPGWEMESWAYHGDDGNSFACTASGKPYGPRYSAQDVVGCGVNFRTGVAFFTKNGVHLGPAFTGIKSDRLYPSVGMKKPGEYLRANFGTHPFVFDIDALMAQERALVLRDIARADTSKLQLPRTEDALVHGLVSQYLAHEGFVETAAAFERDATARETHLTTTPNLSSEHNPAPAESTDDAPTPTPSTTDPSDPAAAPLPPTSPVHALRRQKIRRAILAGDIDKALKYTHTFYPRVLDDDRNRDIHFRLRCRKFVEMIRRCSELDPSSTHPTIADTTTTNPREANGHAPFPHDNNMDLDTFPPLPPQQQHEALLHEALAYGRSLQASLSPDAPPASRQLLRDVFAIMAYARPLAEARGSLVAEVMDEGGRVGVAEGVNGAVLVSLGQPREAALETVCAQTDALLDSVAARSSSGAGGPNGAGGTGGGGGTSGGGSASGNGSTTEAAGSGGAAFVSVLEDFLRGDEAWGRDGDGLGSA